ncbi:MAG: lamin tail domain-containing protein [Bacteroidota bacterium]
MMKKYLFLFVVFPQILWGQYHFDFEGGPDSAKGKDPDWSMEQVPPGRWDGDSVNPIRGDCSLHHSYDNPGPGCDFFMVHHDPFAGGDSLTLTFRVRHGYHPSSSNNWQVAMLASLDLADGIIVGVNFQEPDDLVKIWRAEGGELCEVCASSFNYQESVGTDEAHLFRVTWQNSGLLTLFHRDESPGSLLTQIGSGFPGPLPEGRSLVIRYEYSAAQDRKLWLDEIMLNGHFEADTIPPSVTEWVFEGKQEIALQLSERIILPLPESFLLCPEDKPGAPLSSGCQEPDSIVLHKGTLQLLFSNPVPNRETQFLLVHGLLDENGNCMPDTLLAVLRNEPKWGDVVINEVMVDPEPRAGEFLDEYLELFNRSDYPIQLGGWKLWVGEREYEMADSAFLLLPGDYFLISGVALPNQGASLSICTREGVPVHAASYRSPFEGPDWKAGGGWSLEATDPGLYCGTSELWQFSTDSRGGTPGALNSVDERLDDLEPPVCLYLGFGDKGSIFAQFSEPVRMAEENSGELVIQPGGAVTDSVVRNSPFGDRYTCYFPAGVLARERFRLEFPVVYDCVGNLSGPLELESGTAALPGYGSVVINEIMYDPEEGRPEYIELINPSSLCYDLQELSMDVVAEGDLPGRFTFLSDHSRILVPGDHVVVTRDIRHLRAAYTLAVSGSWVEVEDLKSLPDGGGWIYLCDRSGNTVDRAGFNDQLHMEGMNDTRGISLERIAWDRSGLDPVNWHSAASIRGYATPGTPNSQCDPDFQSLEMLEVEPKVFSPDNDGYEDLLGISLGSMEQGSVIRLWITDLAGNLIKELANNHIAGPVARYTWNGEDDRGSLVNEGFYVIHLRGTHPPSGRVWNKKCALGVVYR